MVVYLYVCVCTCVPGINFRGDDPLYSLLKWGSNSCTICWNSIPWWTLKPRKRMAPRGEKKRENVTYSHSPLYHTMLQHFLSQPWRIFFDPILQKFCWILSVFWFYYQRQRSSFFGVRKFNFHVFRESVGNITEITRKLRDRLITVRKSIRRYATQLEPHLFYNGGKQWETSKVYSLIINSN